MTDGTKEEIIQASYNVCEIMQENIVCLFADGASVNYGHHLETLVQISEMVEGWDSLLFHYLNDSLELAIKHAYKK